MHATCQAFSKIFVIGVDLAKIYSTAIPLSTFININVETSKNRILVRAKLQSSVYLRTHVTHKYSNSILSKTRFVANLLFILPRRISFILWFCITIYGSPSVDTSLGCFNVNFFFFPCSFISPIRILQLQL